MKIIMHPAQSAQGLNSCFPRMLEPHRGIFPDEARLHLMWLGAF